MSNTINYALLNPYPKYKNDLCFKEVYELTYTKDEHTFTLTIGIYKDNYLDKNTKILSLKEIELELGYLYLNAECQKTKRIFPQ